MHDILCFVKKKRYRLVRKKSDSGKRRKMKKKQILSAVLSATLVSSMLMGCGSNSNQATGGVEQKEDAVVASGEAVQIDFWY